MSTGQLSEPPPAPSRSRPAPDPVRLGAKFRPKTVKTLFVGESSPATGSHFYLANSNLFRATREAFALAHGSDATPDGPGFVEHFRRLGCWLVDFADAPVHDLPAADRRQRITDGIARLSSLIAQTKPKRIVVVKASVAQPVTEAAEAAGFTGEIVELPFPVRRRTEFVSRLAAVLAQ